jgi:hypothetical protein
MTNKLLRICEYSFETLNNSQLEARTIKPKKGGKAR